jgi:Fe-S-cluster containining protein
MNITSLEMSKKLKRYGLIQGNSEYFWQKEPNCSVYHIKPKTCMRYFHIDALLWYEIAQKAFDLGFSISEIEQIRSLKTADLQADLLIDFCKSKK